MAAIVEEKGEVVTLTPVEHAAFVAAVQPLLGAARGTHAPELLALRPGR